MLTLLFWVLAGLLGLKIGWNFAIMVYLWGVFAPKRTVVSPRSEFIPVY